MAAAAVGGSHVVASTRAGAEFGWQLVWLILIVNVLKYPFFSAGPRFTVATGKSLQQGYWEQGKAYLVVFTVLNMVVSVTSTAGLTMLTASLLTLFIPLPIPWLAAILLTAILIVLMWGHYRLLDVFGKGVMLVLTIVTLVAAGLAIQHTAYVMATPDIRPDPWQWAYMGILVALMGWMPAPIEISTWNSLWLLAKQQQTRIDKAQTLLDFNVGYILTACLAVLFLALGAMVMYGTHENFAVSGSVFADQLVAMYTRLLGSQWQWLISSVVLLAILSSTITVIDGYSRTLADAGFLLTGYQVMHADKSQGVMMVVVSLFALLLINFFGHALLYLLELAMILSFISSTVFAYLNYRLMVSPALPAEHRFGVKLVVLSWMGLTYFVGFTGLFIYWYYFMM